MPPAARREPPDPARPVALVLPPREGFAEAEAGAIATLVRGLARPRDLVFGRPVAAPFEHRRFRPVRPSPLGLSPRSRYARGVGRAIAASLAGADAPAAIEVHNRPALAGGLARAFPGLPVRLFLHNDPRSMRGSASPRARAALARRVSVCAVSSYLAALWAEGAPHPAAAPEVVPNHVELDRLPAPRAQAARERLVLFAGRIVADKGADLFVEAAAGALAGLSGWRAEMIGADRFSHDTAETPFLAALRARAAAAGIAMRGRLPRAAVLEAMSAAAIVVVPSRWPEPFGLVALEAMACGAALVATAVGALPAVCGDGALLVPPASGALGAAIGGLARDEAARHRLAARGAARAGGFGLEAARARLDAFRAADPR